MKKGMMATKTAKRMSTDKLGNYLAKKGIKTGLMENLRSKEEKGESKKIKTAESKSGMEK